MIEKKFKTIAFYLPQFHPIPENDKWWGHGFTEWTNVVNAKPLFKGHFQPQLPADLGFYDLRLPEVREQQATMAKYAGVDGFAYWHYWFNGKRLLEKPLNDVIKLKSPDFPFCLAWANETWSGIWHGQPNKVLIEQTYPGLKDYENHFYAILDILSDERYIKINGKPIFYIYSPDKIPDSKLFFDCWNKLAIKNGLNEFYFVARSLNDSQCDKYLNLGYSALQTNWLGDAMEKCNISKTLWNRFTRKYLGDRLTLDIWDFEKLSKYLLNEKDKLNRYNPTILTGWDNSPRSGKRGRILTNYNPDTFEMYIKDVVNLINYKNNPEENIVFLRSWNEWAEGNYVEPNQKYGWKYLDVLRKHFLNY